MVPTRCGSSFTRNCCELNPGFICEIDKFLDSKHIELWYNNTDPVQTIKALRSAHPIFNTSKIYIVFRDPVYRYKSGLWMTASNLLTSTILDENILTRDQIQNEIMNILSSLFRNMDQMLFPQYDLGDVHTTPVLVQSLMAYCSFPDAVSFVYINDFNDHLRNTYGEAFNIPNHEKSDVPVPDNEENFKRMITNALNNSDQKYDFSTWIEPDQIVYDYLSKKHKTIDIFSASSKLIQATSVINAITRFNSVANTSHSCTKYVNTELANHLRDQLDNYGDTMRKLVFDRIWNTKS